MGRKKIKIARINDDRNRSVTYLKRKAGLMKKAHELAVLTGSEVAVIVFGQNGKLTEFCSGDMDRVLLRYTEHSGPVERKGPEHYSNDDDEGSDEDGGDVDEGDIAEGGFGASGMAGPSSEQYSPTQGGSNGASDREASRDGKNNKRKAPSGHRMKDGNSLSSNYSSNRGSPPFSTAPVIKVDGEMEDGTSDEANKKGALKAAIIQRSISKPGAHDGNNLIRPQTGMNVQHNSYSNTDMNSSNSSANGANGNLYMPPMPHRPYTAGAMMGIQPSSAAMLPQQYSRQQATSPRFAYSPDPSNPNATLTPSNNPFLRPQTAWPDNSGTPTLMRANSASAINDVSYGDLARGGASPLQSPYKLQQSDHSGSPLPSPQTFNPAHNYASLQLPQQAHGISSSSLLPLAHPILRQHPQYESYSNQLRIQQQQYLGSRSGSHPVINVHTAPSSPNHMMLDDQSGMSSSNVMGGMDSTLSRRSASFGYMDSNADRRDFQQTINQDPYQFVNSFDSSSSEKPLSSQPPSYGHLDASGGDSSAQQTVETPISNAAFNDLMGSILSDMESTTNSTTGTTVNGSLVSSEDRSKENIKGQEEVIRSMESEGSLTTLVNSESFDALLTSGSEAAKSAGKVDKSGVDATTKQGEAADDQDEAAAKSSVEE